MSTTTQEQNHLPSEEHNHNQTNFVNNDKLEANETSLVKNDNHVPQKEHDEPKQNQQMPDQSGTSLTEKINSNAQDEKLPESHSSHSNPEPSQIIEQNLIIEKEQPQEEVLHKKENEATSEAHFEDKEKENVEKNSNLPVSHQEEKIEEDSNLPILHNEKEATPKTLPESKEKEDVEKDSNLPASHQQENIEEDNNLPVSHQEEKEATPKTLQNVEKDKNLLVSQNPEIQHDKEPVETNTPKHENKQSQPEIVHKDENKPDDDVEHQEKSLPQDNDNINRDEDQPLGNQAPTAENDDIQPSSQQNHDESLENQNPQDRTNENDEEIPKQILEEKPLSNAEGEKTEEIQTQEELSQNLNSIVNFFSVTKDNLIQSSDQVVAKLGDIISKSRLGSIIQGHEYTPVITSDPVQQQETASSSTRRRKSSQTDQTPKLRNQSIENPLKVVKSPKKTTLPNKTPVGADSKTFLSPAKLPQTTKQSEFKNRNEIEEQIRQHKIIEIIKQKKALEMKLGSLNEQLVELQKVELSSSPNRSKSKPKESREEFLERKRKAVEFAKKMNQEQKAIEVRNDQRREARQVLVNKEIEALQKLADKKYERKKIMDFIKGQTEVVQKAKYGLSSLEEKKLELKQKREFDKEVDHVNTRDSFEHESPHKLASKSSSKKIYKSPMLPQVLAHDAEAKKIESEKIAKRKALHDKQVDYGRGVKDIFLPKVQSKFEARKHKMGVYKSQQVEAHILRSGKDGLYGYLDKMKNDFEGPKSKKKPLKHHQNDDNDFDRPPTDFADDEEQNVNVAYGKQLVYELQDNWNLADGTMSSRKKHLSPRNPEVNSKYTIKHKKEKDLMIDGDHLSDTEQSVHAKRAEPRYEDDEDY